VLVGLGVTSLSMAPGALPAVAAVLRRTDLQTARGMASAALAASSAAGAARAAAAALASASQAMAQRPA
jgi:phosphotransferase system enzyme I (PtsI)